MRLLNPKPCTLHQKVAEQEKKVALLVKEQEAVLTANHAAQKKSPKFEILKTETQTLHL